MPGYFDDTSVIRRVHREYLVGLGGARALLMQAAHPVAFAGFFMSTGALEDPYPRLARTAAVLDTILFGERVDADAATAAVRRVHTRMRGTLPEPVGRFPAGTPWAADDPDLLLWIIATLADSGALVYRRYVGELTPAELDAYWEDWRVVGSLFGLEPAQMPVGFAGLEAYAREMLSGDVLHVSPTARELGRRIVLRPPVPLLARPLLEVANFVVIGWLPARIRRQYRLWWDPARTIVLHTGAESTRRLLVPVLPAEVRRRTPRAGTGSHRPHTNVRRPVPTA
ncbi:oxygenase MpaB family protein [Conexibacter sp. DBS9H8]|uniref:oxygenase MpaB family protein n=1 Tax=Conexibacter sp. DBS9H8 TaxID=2937801 RepID=UPI00200F8B71|nr:oxygenase MpaB family protein [Conexibacter sp. DBS9H8]